ncbi:MAG: DUF547 domain-containing protein [Burkholderiales bacterium]
MLPASHPALRRRAVLALSLAAVTQPLFAQSFDHQHAAWSALLKKHVVLLGGGKASQVRYAGFSADQASLRSYLAALSSVNAAMFDAFTKAQQMAFLINAYNAFTVELILTRYPKLESIKDLGSLLQSPWKKEFVPLLGKSMSLDGIEHGVLRARGRYDEPRIHFAVNCASIGCPALREEAFVADRLEVQLEEQTRRFMSDRSRNRWNADKQRLEISKIFDWYGEDFRLGHKGINTLAAFCARYADVLADSPADRERIRAMTAPIAFLDYDWKLNDVK